LSTFLVFITYEAARSQLARVLFFKDDVHKKIRFLSGGEKSRLRLCSLTFEKVNFMILDEPTNHLDIDSREVLEETLTAFEGTLLFVSHDRYFINKVAGKIMSFENNHLITYPGDYTYYQEELQKAGKFEDQSNEKARGLSNLLKVYEDDKSYKKEQPQKPYEKKPSIGVEVNQYSRTDNKSRKLNTQKSDILENEIEAIETALKALEQEINNNNSNFEYLQELYLKKETMEKELDFAYDKWENCQ